MGKIDMQDISAELEGIVVLLDALGGKANMPNDAQDGLFSIEMSIRRLIKEIDAQE